MLWLYKTGVFVSKIDLGFTGISDAEYLTNRKVKRAETCYVIRKFCVKIYSHMTRIGIKIADVMRQINLS